MIHIFSEGKNTIVSEGVSLLLCSLSDWNYIQGKRECRLCRLRLRNMEILKVSTIRLQTYRDNIVGSLHLKYESMTENKLEVMGNNLVRFSRFLKEFWTRKFLPKKFRFLLNFEKPQKVIIKIKVCLVYQNTKVCKILSC